MSDRHSCSPSPRVRPVAELSLDPLQERSSEISRSWAIALIEGQPPESLGSVKLDDLARDAPVLVSALLAAVTSDAELERIVGGGRSTDSPAAQLGPMAGAVDPAGVVGAAEALRSVLWEALLDEFGVSAPDPVRARALTDLSNRLAHVCAAILPLALEGVGTTPPVRGDAPAPVAEPTATAPSAARGAPIGVVIVDERAGPEVPTAPVLSDGPLVAEPAASGEIQIRDERGDEGPAAWIRSIGRQLERFEADGISFAVLLVELRVEAPLKDTQITWEPLEEILVDELSTAGGGTMTRERAGRYWLLAPGTDRLGAGSLAERLTRALDSRAPERLPRVAVAIGSAICPEDGRRAPALAAHADVGLFAARAERHLAAPADGRSDL